jgi:hypothetical protein
MPRAVYDLLAIVGVGVLFFATVGLLLGPVRRFFVVLIYLGLELASSLGLTIADVLYKAPDQRLRYEHLYWTNEVALDVLLFLVVIVLTYKATPEGPNRKKVARILTGIGVAALVLPVLLFHPTFAPWPTLQWFNSTAEVLNFGAALMNLALWGALIASRQREPQLLKVSVGLGVVVTAGAISYGLRHLIPVGGVLRPLPNLFIMIAQPVGWSILCWAFWPAARPRVVPSSALPSR